MKKLFILALALGFSTALFAQDNSALLINNPGLKKALASAKVKLEKTGRLDQKSRDELAAGFERIRMKQILFSRHPEFIKLDLENQLSKTEAAVVVQSVRKSADELLEAVKAAQEKAAALKAAQGEEAIAAATKTAEDEALRLGRQYSELIELLKMFPVINLKAISEIRQEVRGQAYDYLVSPKEAKRSIQE